MLGNKMKINNIFAVQTEIKCYGVLYALWFYGFENAWTIFVATRMIARERSRNAYITAR